jgi:hypothetical protein
MGRRRRRRRRRDRNHSPQKNNSIYDSVGNENGYSVPDLNKTMINVTKELSNAHKKKPSQKKSRKNSPRNSWRRY